MSFPQNTSQMELLGTGSLSPYHCFVKSMLILSVIITEQLNGLGNFQFRRIPENISLRFDLDWNQVWKAPSNFHWTANLAFEPNLIGKLKLAKPWIGSCMDLMWMQVVSLKIIWGSALDINCHVQLRPFPGLRLFLSLFHPKIWGSTCQSQNCKGSFSKKLLSLSPLIRTQCVGATARNFSSYTWHYSGAFSHVSLQAAWKRPGQGVKNSKDRCAELQFGVAHENP